MRCGFGQDEAKQDDSRFKENEADARKKYHSTLSNMYSTEGLEHVMCVLENDYCGQILKESYFVPKKTQTDEQEQQNDII